MSRSVYDMVEEFMARHESPVHTPELWLTLIDEELLELQVAIASDNLVAMAREAGDVVYVLTGWMRSLGVDLSAVIEEIHRANMTKDGEPRSDGKITKGPNYQEPDLAALIYNQP